MANAEPSCWPKYLLFLFYYFFFSKSSSSIIIFQKSWLRYYYQFQPQTWSFFSLRTSEWYKTLSTLKESSCLVNEWKPGEGPREQPSTHWGLEITDPGKRKEPEGWAYKGENSCAFSRDGWGFIVWCKKKVTGLFINTYTYSYTLAHILTLMHAHLCTYTFTHAYTHSLFTYIHSCTDTHTCNTHAHVLIVHTHTHIHAHIHLCTHTHSSTHT